MRRLILYLLFLTLSVWIGVQIIEHPGNVLIILSPWTIQMPIWAAILITLILFGIFYLFINGIDKIYFTYYRLTNWLRFRRAQQSYSKTQQGLSLLIEERWLKAEKLLLAGLTESSDHLMNYLGAAKAAAHLGALDRRNTYLQKAHQAAPRANLAIGLTQAELEMANQEYSNALQILTQLRIEAPRHSRVLSLLEKTYIHLKEWQKLANLLPYLYKAKIITKEQMLVFEKNISIELLKEQGTHLDQLQLIWKNLSRNIKKNPEVVLAYSQLILKLNQSEPVTKEIEELIRKTLKNHWQPELVHLYISLPTNNVNRQLIIVNAWVKIHGQQAMLLYALGHFCTRIQLWGKAKDYFEKSLTLASNPEVFLAYGQLLDILDEPLLAKEKYRQGLEISSNKNH